MLVRPHNVPEHATGRLFGAKNGKKGEYWVWQRGNKYYWQANVNCGEEDSFDEAAEAARRWIRGDK